MACRRISRVVHSSYPAHKLGLVHEELEQLLAVQLEHRNPLSIGAVELRIERHIDLAQLERMLRSNALDHGPRVVAQVTAGLPVEGYARHPGDAATLVSWTTSS
jgi:hypothetical protein